MMAVVVGWRWLGMLLLLLSSAVWSDARLLTVDNNARQFLPAHEAFRFSHALQGRQLQLSWQVTPEHYLYRQQFAVLAEPGGEALAYALPAHDVPMQDEYFGDVRVYRTDVHISLLVPDGIDAVTVRWQGCADAGLCYPPDSARISLASAASPAPVPGQLGDATRWLSEQPLWRALLIFLAIGVGLSFTPCVLPMLPILSAVISGQQDRSWQRGLSLSASYVAGMTLMFTAAGVLLAWLGARANLAILLQKPVVLISFALLFMLFAWLLASDRALALPAPLRERLQRYQQRQQGGQHGPVFVLGAISTLVVSPCVSAPLAGILLYISLTGDLWLGAASLFALSLGMGLPLLVLGAGGARLLPRSGPWLQFVKQLFAWLLVALALSLVYRLLPGLWGMLSWVGLLLVVVIWLGLQAGLPLALRGLLMGVGLGYATLLALAAQQGHHDPFKPWSAWDADRAEAVAARGLHGFVDITDPARLEGELAEARRRGQPVFVDVYADWCVSCITFEREVLSRPEVMAALSPGRLLRFDITRATRAQLDWLQQAQLFGPPALLFWDGRGQPTGRLLGEPDAATFLAEVRRAWAVAD